MILVVWSTQLVGYATTFPWLGVIVPLLALSGLATIVLAWSSSWLVGDKTQPLAWVTLTLALVAFAIWAFL